MRLSVVLIIGFLVLAMPFTLRAISEKGFYADNQVYYNMRASDAISNGIYYDQLENRPFELSLINYLGILTNYNIILPILLGLISLFILFKFSREYYNQFLFALIAPSLFALSPIFIFLFSSMISEMLALFFFFIWVWLYHKKSLWSVALLSLIAISDIEFFFVSLILLGIYYLYDKNNRLFSYNLLSIIVAAIFYFFNPFYLDFVSPSFSNYFTSFGAQAGVSIFYLFLALLGIFIFWKKTRSKKYFFTAFFVMFIFSLFLVEARIIFTVMLCLLAANFSVFLIKRVWAIPIIKRFTLLLILCGIIFSSALFINHTINMPPNKELIQGLDFLKTCTPGGVLSSDDLGFIIQYYSDHPTTFDNINQTQPDIFYSRDLNFVKDYFKKNNIKFVLVTSKVNQNLWSKEDQGLLFLLNNAANFDLIYGSDNLRIW